MASKTDPGIQIPDIKPKVITKIDFQFHTLVSAFGECGGVELRFGRERGGDLLARGTGESNIFVRILKGDNFTFVL